MKLSIIWILQCAHCLIIMAAIMKCDEVGDTKADNETIHCSPKQQIFFSFIGYCYLFYVIYRRIYVRVDTKTSIFILIITATTQFCMRKIEYSNNRYCCCGIELPNVYYLFMDVWCWMLTCAVVNLTQSGNKTNSKTSEGFPPQTIATFIILTIANAYHISHRIAYRIYTYCA